MPEGAVCVFSAHGVAPSVREGAIERRLQTIDATCPLVTKVHREAVRFAEEGYTIVLVGHDGHEEVEGTMGEAPERIVLVQSEEDVEELEVADPERVAYVTQTTLAVDETAAIIARLRERFPAIVGPRTDDICYATTNRQAAVKQMASFCDLMLVIGSRNSSNSVRLVEVARDCGTEAHLIDNAGEVREEWLEGRRVVGISSGASAPENLVRRARRVLPRARRAATSRSSTWSARTCASCSRSRSASPSPRAGAPDRTLRRVDRHRARNHQGRAAMRTLIVSDLHLGSLSGADLLRRTELRASLLEALDGVDRLVLLGDVLELRHGPVREAMSAAQPFFEDARARARRTRARARGGQPRPCARRTVAGAPRRGRRAAAAGAGAGARARAGARRRTRGSPPGRSRRERRSPTRACGCARTCMPPTATSSTAT